MRRVRWKNYRGVLAKLPRHYGQTSEVELFHSSTPIHFARFSTILMRESRKHAFVPRLNYPTLVTAAIRAQTAEFPDDAQQLFFVHHLSGQAQNNGDR
jgi:hypothetical protein